MHFEVDLSRYGPSKMITLRIIDNIKENDFKKDRNSLRITFGLTVLDNDKKRLKLKYFLPGL